MDLCGDACKGSFFSTQFATVGARRATKEFVARYTTRHDREPDEVAALTWDAVGLLLHAVQRTKGLTGDVREDRKAVRDQLARVRDYDGVTGRITFDGKTGDPLKCVSIVKINQKGRFEFYQSVCP